MVSYTTGVAILLAAAASSGIANAYTENDEELRHERETECVEMHEGYPRVCVKVCTTVTSTFVGGKLIDEVSSTTQHECDDTSTSEDTPTYSPSTWYPTYFPTKEDSTSGDEDMHFAWKGDEHERDGWGSIVPRKCIVKSDPSWSAPSWSGTITSIDEWHPGWDSPSSSWTSPSGKSGKSGGGTKSGKSGGGGTKSGKSGGGGGGKSGKSGGRYLRSEEAALVSSGKPDGRKLFWPFSSWAAPPPEPDDDWDGSSTSWSSPDYVRIADSSSTSSYSYSGKSGKSGSYGKSGKSGSGGKSGKSGSYGCGGKSGKSGSYGTSDDCGCDCASYCSSGSYSGKSGKSGGGKSGKSGGGGTKSGKSGGRFLSSSSCDCDCSTYPSYTSPSWSSPSTSSTSSGDWAAPTICYYRKVTPNPTPYPTKPPTKRPTKRPTKKPTTKAPTSCEEERKWYATKAGCSNGYYPRGTLYDDADDCCKEEFPGTGYWGSVCKKINVCIDTDEPTPSPSDEPTISPTTPAPTTCEEDRKWYKTKYGTACTNGDSPRGTLYDSGDECCEEEFSDSGYGWSKKCKKIDICNPTPEPTPSPTTPAPTTCEEDRKWYKVKDEMACTNGDSPRGTLYDSGDECCEEEFSDSGYGWSKKCKKIDTCNPTPEPTPSPTTPAPTTCEEDRKWYKVKDEMACTNGDSPRGTLYDSGDECCEEEFSDSDSGYGWSKKCKKIDTCNPTPEPTPSTPEPTPSPTECEARTWHYNEYKDMCDNKVVDYANVDRYDTMEECCEDKFGDTTCPPMKVRDECCEMNYPTWYWKPNGGVCTNVPLLGAPSSNIYDSRSECCKDRFGNSQPDVCDSVDICNPETPEPTPAPTSCLQRKWHMVKGKCTNPPGESTDADGDEYDTLSECCEDSFGEGEKCQYLDTCFSPAPTMMPTEGSTPGSTPTVSKETTGPPTILRSRTGSH